MKANLAEELIWIETFLLVTWHVVVVQIRAHSGNTFTVTFLSHMEVFYMFSYANTAPMNQPESQAWDAWIKKIQKHSGIGRIRVKVLELLSK